MNIINIAHKIIIISILIMVVILCAIVICDNFKIEIEKSPFANISSQNDYKTYFDGYLNLSAMCFLVILFILAYIIITAE